MGDACMLVGGGLVGGGEGATFWGGEAQRVPTERVVSPLSLTY